MIQLSISDKSFRQIADLVYENAGIILGDNKREFVIARLSKRLRLLGLDSFDEYFEFVKASGNNNGELTNMIDAITTTKTEFFREAHHFDFMQEILPSIYSEGESCGKRRLRVWSAACSTGEEPYSAAMVLHDFFRGKPGWDVRILASDINTCVLRFASAGIYNQDSLEAVPPEFRKRYFYRVNETESRQWKVVDELRRMILFRRINLIYDEFRFRIPVDMVFCRNTIIYFDNDKKRTIASKLHSIIRPGGYIFVGHSESLLLFNQNFRFKKNTVYQQI